MADLADRASHQETWQTHFALREIQSRVADMATSPMDTGPRLCIDCGQPIPPGRIKALPGARRCVSCQEKYETGRED